MDDTTANLTLYRLLPSNKYFSVNDLGWILDSVFNGRHTINTVKRVAYYDVPCAFDIETSSFYVEDSDLSETTKQACMYEWTLGINGYCIIGRTWDEFKQAMDTISKTLRLYEYKRLVIYVHNLAYEFQWIRKMFDWLNVFSLKQRKPVYAVTTTGIEFRCSLILSGYSLANLGKNELKKYKVEKMVGDLDYSLLRHSETPLTDKEIGYCLNDVKVVMAYIQERIEADGNITKIPLTKTGYVRRYCRDECVGTGPLEKCSGSQNRYRKLIRSLTLEPDEYTQLKAAFQGGFTHASPWYSGKTLYDVDSYDFTSSYPAVIVSEKFPMSTSEKVVIHDKDEFMYNINNYCCLFDVHFTNIRPKLQTDNIISISHCWKHEGKYQTNNGRVVWAEHIYTTITEVDFVCISWFYDWDEMEIANFRRYEKAYLPTPFVEAVLKLYKDKTELKGIDGKEAEYGLKKGMLNSCYGMMVTDICKSEITYVDDEWGEEEGNLSEQIAKYNKGFGRFLFYPWGIWVTAYARKNLYTGIREVNEDYVYSDTDSLKMLHGDRHTDYINEYNEYVTKKIHDALLWHWLPWNTAAPKSSDGVAHPLGVWDYEGHYDRFKTLGAKRYMLQAGDKYSLTVAGLNKKQAMEYISDKSENPFDFFTNEMDVPAEFTGKLTHTYIDDEISGTIVDYMGNIGTYHELSAVHMEHAKYSLKLSAVYAAYLLNIQEDSDGI